MILRHRVPEHLHGLALESVQVLIVPRSHLITTHGSTRLMSLKTRFVLFPATLLALAVGTACAGAPAAAPTGGSGQSKPAAQASPKAAQAGGAGDAARGAPLYVSSCSACHGPDAKGVPNLGKPLAGSAFVKGQTDAQLVDFTKRGRPASDPANTTKIDMPPKGGNPALTDAQLADIVAHLRTLNP